MTYALLTKVRRITQLALLSGLVLLPLSACTSIFTDVKDTWQYALERYEDADLSATEIEEFPYTALYVRQADQPRALVVLAFVDEVSGGREHTWASAGNELLVTRHGRVIQSYGMEPELRAVSGLQHDPLACMRGALSSNGFSAANTCLSPWEYQIDILDTEAKPSTYAMRSRFSVHGVERLTLPRGEVDVLLVTEQVEAEGRRSRQWQNRYWLANDGHILQSEQQLIPTASRFTITQVKWVGRDDHDNE